jgi:hypothetical protein
VWHAAAELGQAALATPRATSLSECVRARAAQYVAFTPADTVSGAPGLAPKGLRAAM